MATAEEPASTATLATLPYEGHLSEMLKNVKMNKNVGHGKGVDELKQLLAKGGDKEKRAKPGCMLVIGRSKEYHLAHDRGKNPYAVTAYSKTSPISDIFLNLFYGKKFEGDYLYFHMAVIVGQGKGKDGNNDPWYVVENAGGDPDDGYKGKPRLATLEEAFHEWKGENSAFILVQPSETIGRKKTIQRALCSVFGGRFEFTYGCYYFNCEYFANLVVGYEDDKTVEMNHMKRRMVAFNPDQSKVDEMNKMRDNLLKLFDRYNVDIQRGNFYIANGGVVILQN